MPALRLIDAFAVLGCCFRGAVATQKTSVASESIRAEAIDSGSARDRLLQVTAYEQQFW